MQIPQSFPTLDLIDILIILELMLNHHTPVVFPF
jgi:hypothetical protein